MIEGVKVSVLKKNIDKRGWLTEIYREDGGYVPKMGYVSMTHPYVLRGPHEHHRQTDCFTFLGSFKIQLWDNRVENGETMTIFSNPDEILSVIVPPKVVHGYQNIGNDNGFVINHPDKLFGGVNRNFAVDEVRHEDIHSKFKFDFVLPEWNMEA